MSKDSSTSRTAVSQSDEQSLENILSCWECGEEICNVGEAFIDIFGVIFCSRECFYHAKSHRDPRIYELQKAYDRHAPRINMFTQQKQKYRHLWNKHT